MSKNKIFDKMIYYFIIFIFGALSGYIYEVVFYYITLGFINNWGILYGPYLPIYGVGAIFLSMLYPLRKKPLLVFLLSIFVTGLVEYIIGYIALNIFSLRLWDYRGLLLNINGLVCLRSVLSFSVGGLILIYIIIPIVNRITKYNIIKYISIIIAVVFFVDIILSTLYRKPYQF